MKVKEMISKKQMMVVGSILIILIAASIVSFSHGETLTKNNISEKTAMEIADEYVQSRLSPDEISELDIGYIEYYGPYSDGDSGIYSIRYSRIIEGIPSTDGVKIRINAETGEMYNYHKTWSIDEDEISLIDTKPSISSSEVAKIITDYMLNEPAIGKENNNTVEIISSELYWKEDHNETVHLAWCVNFKDSTFEHDDYLVSARIDAHSGEMLLFDYLIMREIDRE
jgi:hypothetical protein